MSATDIFRCKDAMPIEGEGVVQPHTTSQTSDYANLPGQRKFPNDVQNVRGGMPNPTGRRP